MLSFNNIYGQPAALMRRRIWSGEERKLPSVSVLQENDFQMHTGFLPIKNTPPDFCVFNGRVHVLVFGKEVYTTPDFKTLTLRFSVPGAPNDYGAITSVVQRGGTIIVGMSYMSGITPMNISKISTNDGASFTDSWFGHYMMSAGEYFFGAARGQSGVSSIYRSATGLESPWATVPMPSMAYWNQMLHNGSVYLALADLASYGRSSAFSDSGASFIVSDGWSTALNQLPSTCRPTQAVVVGTTFVLVGGNGKRLCTLRSDNGRWFNVHSQLLNTEDGDDIQAVTHACVVEGVIYARATCSDAQNVQRSRLLVSTDAGLTWNSTSCISAGRMTSTGGYAGLLCPLAPGKGLYYAPGLNNDFGLTSDMSNDRDFYYELGAA
ncbi:hypothetical protein [Delftia sp. ASV31]|uniref:hypothetical protein n=1 Tax=Delftia sp. ASV31 TaxID=2795113 RepID=UPI0018EB718E|nr:hypothetical protein [Delftia sp. ASV31]